MTTAPFAPSGSSPLAPASVLADAREMVAGLHGVLWAAKSPREKLDAVAEVERFKSELAAIEAEVVAEVEATRAATVDQWGSTGAFVTAVSGGYQGSGSSAVRLAQALTGDRDATLAALRGAVISEAQARVIVAVVDELPSKPALRDRAEAVLLEHAKTLNASELRAVGKRLVEVVDPKGDERRLEKQLAKAERAAHYGRFLSIREDGAGGVWMKGRATVEDAATIKAALFPLAAPVPATDPGGCGGAADCAGPAGCAHDGRDPRDHGARMLDALVEASRLLLGTDVLPESHGATPRLSLTMNLSDLIDGVGTATLETGETLSASAVRRLACDAEVIPIVLGSHSEVLDLGRLRRLVSLALFKALAVRDMHCTFPGCRRPPIACDAHHIIAWLDGGGTGLDNLALVCRGHHTMIHNTPWEIRLNPVDRRPEFLPPATLDPDRKPIRERCPRE